MRDHAEYPCKCGLPMSHTVGETAVLVKHGDDQRSVIPGEAGRYDALDWISGLHSQAEADASADTDTAIKSKRKKRKDGN